MSRAILRLWLAALTKCDVMLWPLHYARYKAIFLVLHLVKNRTQYLERPYSTQKNHCWNIAVHPDSVTAQPLLHQNFQANHGAGDQSCDWPISKDIGVCEVLLASEAVIGRCYWLASALEWRDVTKCTCTYTYFKKVSHHIMTHIFSLNSLNIYPIWKI